MSARLLASIGGLELVIFFCWCIEGLQNCLRIDKNTSNCKKLAFQICLEVFEKFQFFYHVYFCLSSKSGFHL